MTNRKYYLVVLLCSILPFLGIFSTNLLPHTSDGAMQLARAAAYYKALQNFHIPVRWAGDLDYGYGMPLFVFIYHTPFWVFSLLIFLGMSLISSFKVVLALSFLISGVCMYAFAYAWEKDQKKALLITIFYQFAPYRLVEILVRGSAGGIYAYSFLPLALFGIVKTWEKPRISSITLTAIGVGLMIVSHNSLALVFFGILVLFILFFAPNRQKQLISFLGLTAGLGLSCWYWMPALLEHKYTYGDLFMKNLYKVNFPAFQNLFIPNFFNNPALRVSEISVQIGFFHTIVLVVGLILLYQKKLDTMHKKVVIFSAFLVAISVFFMLPISTPFWQASSMLRQFQFPWRFLAIPVFATSMLAPLLLDISWLKSSRIFWIIVILTVSTTAYFWQPTQGYDHVTNGEFWNYPLNTTYFGETDLTWSAGLANGYPKERIQVSSGKAEIHNFTRTTISQKFTVDAQSPSEVVSNTQYYPGWIVLVDGKETSIQFQNPNWRGLITFSVPTGQHIVQLMFTENRLRKSSDVISIFTLIAIILLSIFIHRDIPTTIKKKRTTHK